MEKPIALVFDLGNVLLPIDLDKTYQAFADFGSIYSAAEIKQITTEEGLWVAYESGMETCLEFQNRIIQRFQLSCSQGEFIKAFNALLYPIQPETSDYLAELSSQFPLFLLSNTSKIHSELFLSSQYPHFNLFDAFTNIHLSFEMGMVKPNVHIYQKVIELNNLQNHQIVFLMIMRRMLRLQTISVGMLFLFNQVLQLNKLKGISQAYVSHKSHF